MDSANKCRKFEANIFNKTKCQNCFKGKEDHSAEALECNRNCRKVTGCGYLFVAPDSFNFSNNIDRTKRWQRRFFVLYDDGEFIYSVDENIHTIPQGVIDMNQCSDVFNAQEFTGHQYSIGIKTQDKTTYIKGTSKDEISRWQDLLVVYPKNFKCQPQFRRNPGPAKSNKNLLQTEIDLNSPSTEDLSLSAARNRVNVSDKAQDIISNSASGKATVLNASVDAPSGSRTTSYILTGSMQKPGSTQKMPPADYSGASSKGLTEKAPQTYRGVRNMKHKNDKTYVDQLRKSNSLQNLSSANAGSGESHPDLLGRSSSSDRLSKQQQQQQTRFGENNTVSSFCASSSPARAHGLRSSLSMTNLACMHNTPRRPLHDSLLLNSNYECGSRGALRRQKSSASLELEKFSNTNIVSNTAQFYEQMAADSVLSVSPWPQSENPGHFLDDEAESRSRHASSSPFRNQQLSRDAERSRSRSRTVTVDTRRSSRDSLTDGWGPRKRGTGFEYNGTGDFFPISHVTSTPRFRNQSRNETDEFKMAKSSPDTVIKSSEILTNQTCLDHTSNDLMFVKKGWLMKQAVDKTWKKCWCVLTSRALTYYNDSKHTDSLENVEGVIILTGDTTVEELPLLCNYSFRISNKTNENVLSATTLGMRSSWIQDIVKCCNSFADSNSHLQPSSLESTNTAISWRSFATSDSDAEYDTKSRTSSSSWHAFHPVAAAVKALPLGTTTPTDRSDAVSSERPYRYLSTSTGHGFAEDPSSGNLQNAPDLLNRRTAGNQARRDHDQTNSGIHNHSTDVGLLKHVDSVDNDTKYSDRRRSSYDSEKNGKIDDGRPSVRKDTLSSSQFRAPSTKIMERTRTKSPRHARSPPPSSSVEPLLDGTVEGRRLPMETRIRPSTLHGTGDNSLLDLMKFEVAALRQQLDATRSQLEESQSAIASLRKKLVDSSEECQNLTDNLEADKKDHLIQLNRLQQKLSDSTLLAETQNQEILELRNKNQQLVERERNKLDLEYLEKESLRRELMDKSSFISKLESDLKAFRASVHEKEGVIAALDRNWEEKIENAKARWKLEKKALDDQLKETENRLNLLLRQSETVGIESRNVTNVLRDKEGMLSQLQEQLMESEKKLQCTLKELELEMEDNTRIHKELDDYCKENASLKMKLAAEAEKASELDADVRHLREEKQGLVSLTSEKETKNALLLQDVERVEGQLRKLVEENAKLRTDLDSRNQEDTEMIQKKFYSKVAEVEKLKSDLKLRVDECRSLTKLVEGIEADKTAARDKIAELEGRLSAFRDVSNPQLDDELQKLAFEKEALEQKVISLNQAMKKLMAENEAETKTREEVRVENKKSILQLKCEYGELIEQHKTVKRGHQQLQAKYESLTKLNTDLNKQLKENCEALKQSESKLKSLERQVESQKAVVDRQKSTKCDMVNTGDGSTEVVEKDLKEKCASLAKQLKQLQMEKQQMESRCDVLEAANKTLKQEQRNAEVSHTSELEQLNSKVSEMTAKLSHLERRNCRLEQQLRSDDDSGRLDDVACNAELRNKTSDVALQGPSDAPTADTKLLEDLKSENEQLLKNNQKLLNQLQEMEESIQRDDDTDEVDIGGKNYKENNRILQMAEKERVLDCMIEELEEMKAELERKESSHIQEIQALKDGYEIRIRSLEHDLSVGRLDLAESVEEQNQDLHLYEQKLTQMKVELQAMQSKNDLEKTNFLEEVNDQKDRVRRLESELRMVYQELEKVKATDDGNASGQSMNDLREEIKQLRVLLSEERARHVTEIVKIRNDPNMDPAKASEVDAILRVKELEEQIQNMKDDYEHELQMQKASHRRELMSSKDDVMQLLAAAEANSIPIDEESIRRKYVKEVEQIKNIYDKGVSNSEKSHQRTMMELRRNHKIELDRLRQEKDQLLKEEAMATQAALDAMRKAHENDLQKERNKFLDLIAKTFSHADMETLQRQHEEDLELLHYEMKQLSEKFSIKCLENAALTERFVAITKSLHENRKRVQDLLSRNDELNSQLKNKVERLNRAVGFPLAKVDLDVGLEKQDLNNVEVRLQVNQMEILQLREQLENARLGLAVKTEELNECTEKYHEVSTELHHLRKRPSTDQSSRSVSDADSPHLFLGRSSSAPSRRECFDDEEKNVLMGGIGSSPPDEVSDHEIGQFDLGLSGQLEMDVEANTSRRSLWRFKNPQRARSNPAVSHPTALKKSTASSAEADVSSLRSSTSSVSTSSVQDNSEAAEASQEELIKISDC